MSVLPPMIGAPANSLCSVAGFVADGLGRRLDLGRRRAWRRERRPVHGAHVVRGAYLARGEGARQRCETEEDSARAHPQALTMHDVYVSRSAEESRSCP